MMLFDDTPALQQFLTACFHEDWTMDRRNYVEVVREFIASEPREGLGTCGLRQRMSVGDA